MTTGNKVYICFGVGGFGGPAEAVDGGRWRFANSAGPAKPGLRALRAPGLSGAESKIQLFNRKKKGYAEQRQTRRFSLGVLS